jgi:hypothetical protein
MIALLAGLLDRWEAELEVLRGCNAVEAAATRERDIRELREWWTERELDELTLEEASAYSGIPSETLRKKVSTGKLPNAGEPGRPRVRRGDLPAKPSGQPRHPEAISLADKILARRGVS